MDIWFSSSLLKRINQNKESYESVADFIIRAVSDKLYELEHNEDKDD